MGKKVAISYGHGSDTYDKGSKGVTVKNVKYPEHEHNYKVGVQVTKILKEHGVDVLEVQPPNKKDVSLSLRTKQANGWKADLYYSIHSNAGTPKAKGYAGFYWSSSKEGKKIAEIYAKHIKEAGFPLYSGGTYPSVKGTWSDFHELRETAMPAILTENGFMTNAEDFKTIFLDKKAQEREAIAHAKTILEYFGIKYKGKATEKAPVKATEPAKAPVKAPAKETKKELHRVFVNDKQVGAYGSRENAVDHLEKALKDGAKDVTIELS